MSFLGKNLRKGCEASFIHPVVLSPSHSGSSLCCLTSVSPAAAHFLLFLWNCIAEVFLWRTGRQLVFKSQKACSQQEGS